MSPNIKREIGRAFQFGEDIFVREALPCPFVLYTPCFLGFAPDLKGKLSFCSCSRTAIENNLEICRMGAEGKRSSDTHEWRFYKDYPYPKILLQAASILASKDHPNTSHQSPSWSSCRDPLLAISRIESLKRLIEYRDGLCHKCCRRLPYSPYGFCTYIHQALYANGLFNFGDIALADKCPGVLRTMSKEDR